MRQFFFEFILICLSTIVDEVMVLTCGPISKCSTILDPKVIYKFTCHCDTKCSHYGDCCIDSVYRNGEEAQQEETCIRVYGGRYSPKYNIYVKTRCPDWWDKDDFTKKACEWNYTDLQDPYTRLPVTNPHTQVTYKNYYCAICHDDGVFSLPWTVEAPFWPLESYNETYGNLTLNYHKDNLSYNKDIKDWGVWLYDQGKRTFVPCHLSIYPGDRLIGKTRWCIPDLVSDCSSSWKLDDVRQQCWSYMDVVDISRPYRNIHCAMCNYENVSAVVTYDYWCISPPGPPQSFTALTRGSIEEEKGEGNCAPGESFDSFAQICRQLTCLPGESLVNGECL